MTRSLVFALSATFCLGATVSCYTIDFDPAESDVFYCQTDSECDANQACWEFRCVDDEGPQVRVTSPESLQNVQNGTAELTVNYNVENFTFSDSNEFVPGQGRVHVSIAGSNVELFSEVPQGATLDISGLEPGAYRVRVQAFYGDGTPYPNPSATVHSVFYLEAENTHRPQAAVVFPYPDYKHIINEPLTVTIAARNFDIVETGEDCRIDPDCDPWNPDMADCLPACPVTPSGHPHVYLLDNYPACLDDAITCNGDYVQSLRPSEGVDSTSFSATATIPADRFTEPGTFTFSAGLQYNDHEPYPNTQFIIYDQITITVGER